MTRHGPVMRALPGVGVAGVLLSLGTFVFVAGLDGLIAADDARVDLFVTVAFVAGGIGFAAWITWMLVRLVQIWTEGRRRR